MQHIRFDSQRRVVGHHGAIGLDAAEHAGEWIAANKNRDRVKPSESNKSAAEAFKASMKGLS